MKTVGIICEYNPFHNGHQRQIQLIRERFGPDTAVVCLMSGNYVQRGAPALLDKSIRAQAAVLSGADLVLELPVTVSLSSAEGCASGGGAILRRCCDVLCFGTESMTEKMLLQTASALLSPPFSDYLKTEMNSGCSFPKARQQALERMGIHAALSNPNDILGVEYGHFPRCSEWGLSLRCTEPPGSLCHGLAEDSAFRRSMAERCPGGHHSPAAKRGLSYPGGGRKGDSIKASHHDRCGF